MSGLFVAIEGPNGVGKTTVVARLASRIASGTKASVHTTTEPTHTEFGELLRRGEATIRGRALALAIAADRMAHLENEIIPKLSAGQHVVTDRYVQSSLVLQRIDGLELNEIWSYNRHVIPAISFYLEDDPKTIQARLAGRNRRSRLESIGSPATELQLYRAAAHHLEKRGWQQHWVDCRGLDPEEVVTVIIDKLL